MALPLNRADAVAYTALGLAVLAGGVLWPRLPAEMAIHFDATSTPDSFVARPVGVLLVAYAIHREGRLPT